MNFYGWIRESVKRAVLLGVSDAVEEMGTAGEEKDESTRQLLAVLRGDAALDVASQPSTTTSGGGRKRLGKSLAGVQKNAKATA